MNIDFGDLRVSTDRYNWILQIRLKDTVEKETGRVRQNFDTLGYFGTADSLLRAMPDMLLRLSKQEHRAALASVRSCMEQLVAEVRGMTAEARAELAEALRDDVQVAASTLAEEMVKSVGAK